MTTTPAPSAVLRWGPLVAFGLLLVALARHAGEGISDPDTLWHILAGEHLWRTGSFSGPDPLSHFTVEPWVLNQWLPDLGLALANHLGGLAAVVWLTQLWRLAVCVAVFALCRLVAGPLPASLVAALAILGTTESLSPRPQLVGFVALAVVVGAWLRSAEDGKARWWLVPVMWLWASSHGTWVAGVSVSAAVVVGMVLDHRPPRAQAIRWAAVVALGAAVTSLTPVGPRLYGSFATVRAVSPYVLEWRHPTLSSVSAIATAALAVLVVVLWVSRRTHPGWTRIALLVVGVAWAALSMRSVAIGAIVLAPLAAEALGAGLGRPRSPVTGGERSLLGGALVASLVLAGALAAAGPREPVGVPAALNPSLSALPQGSVVFNSDLLGGWLMWTHPELRQASDTRAELYGPDRARAYLRIVGTAPGWPADFEALHPQAALVEDASPLEAALAQIGWQVRGRDAGYVLLEPPVTG